MINELDTKITPIQKNQHTEAPEGNAVTSEDTACSNKSKSVCAQVALYRMAFQVI